jgi:hypothetical protein
MNKRKIHDTIKPIIIIELFQAHLDNLPFEVKTIYGDSKHAFNAYTNDPRFHAQVDRCVANILWSLDNNNNENDKLKDLF